MKYEIEFVFDTEPEEKSRNVILIFGQDDIIGVAKKCFEYGKKGNYKEIRFRRIRKEI